MTTVSGVDSSWDWLQASMVALGISVGRRWRPLDRRRASMAASGLTSDVDGGLWIGAGRQWPGQDCLVETLPASEWVQMRRTILSIPKLRNRLWRLVLTSRKNEDKSGRQNNDVFQSFKLGMNIIREVVSLFYTQRQ